MYAANKNLKKKSSGSWWETSIKDLQIFLTQRCLQYLQDLLDFFLVLASTKQATPELGVSACAFSLLICFFKLTSIKK